MEDAQAHIPVAVPDHVIARLVGGNTVLLDVNSGRSFTLDPVGSRVWSLLETTGSLPATVDALVDEFLAERVQVEHDVAALVDQLVEGGLLARGGA